MRAEEKLAQLYEEKFGTAPANVAPLAGAGSNRRYFRLSGYMHKGGGETVIGTIGTDRDENLAFIELSHHFASKGLPVPGVLAVGNDGLAYLPEDLGGESLYDAIAHGRQSGGFTIDEQELLAKTIKMLPHVQFTGSEGLDFSVCYPQEAMDAKMVSRDLNYFNYDFLKPSGLEFSESRLDDEFDKLSEILMRRASEASAFMVRDFQSRNVMLVENAPFLIDFQGGRRGPEEYDVASFLWQARANIPENLRDVLIEEYINEARMVSQDFNENKFRKYLPFFVLFRMLQTLGAYGFRGWIEGKPHFIKSIPTALTNLREHLHSTVFCEKFPYLNEIINRLPELPKVVETTRLSSICSYDGLTVIVGSFSYKRGMPVDLSGNGGGFIFDCRAIHNPGRYDPYKHLTGRDEPVRRFLEEEGRIDGFISHAKALSDASVETYLRRGFNSLCVYFGCTGGQHRSVYSAEALAAHIAKSYPQVRVVLYHREQDILEIKEADI